MNGQADWRPLGRSGAVATGLAGVVVAIMAFFDNQNWMAVGVCLIASAIAFGSLSREH